MKKNIIIFISILIVFILVLASYQFGMISIKVALPTAFLLLGGMNIHLAFFIASREKNVLVYFQFFFTIIMGLFFFILGWEFFQMYR